MNVKNEDGTTRRAKTVSMSHHVHVVMVLIAICCLSIGIAIGSILRGDAGARSAENPPVAATDAPAVAPDDDNRLAINNSTNSPDALSAIFARVAEQVEPAVTHIKVFENEIYSREGTGSGVIVHPGGFIITNQHVVGRAIKIKVKLANGNEYDAKVIGQDPLTDLAVIKIEAREPLPVARMGNSDKLNVGDWVLAIGSPFGLEQTVTAGIISAKDRVADSVRQSAFQQFLQTDAAINPGNSGGPLVNLAGEVVGINTQIATSSGVYNGIGFALPSATLVEIYNQLVTDGRVRRGFLGITPVELTPQIARLNKVADKQGVLVSSLTSDASPAALAGLQTGDVITIINGQKVKNVRELIRRIASLPVGSTAEIGYLRNGELRTAQVKLVERKEDGEEPLNTRPTPFDPRNPRGLPEKEEGKSFKPKPSPTLGLSAKTLTADLAKLRSMEGARGAYITGVEPGSLAEDNDIRVDDLIIEINYKPVVTLEDFLRITRELKSGDDVFMRVLRKDRGTLRRSVIVSFTMP